MWSAVINAPDNALHYQKFRWSLLSDQISVGAMAILAYEYLLTFDDEVELIWVKRSARSPIKWLFIFIRYFGLVAGITDRGMRAVELSTYWDGSISSPICLAFYVFRLISGLCLVAAVEIILIIRVHALYKSVKVMILIGFLFFSEILVVVINWPLVLPKLHFEQSCLTSLPIRLVTQYGVTVLCLQIIIFGLTIGKHMVARRSGWNHTPIISLLLRDGAMAFMVMSTIQIFLLSYSMAPGGLAFIHPWMLSLMSCVGCRLIINLQRLAVSEQQGHVASGTLEFTTQLYESQRISAAP